MTIEKRLERVEAILDARGLDWDYPRAEDDHFVGAGKMVAKEPALDGLPDIRTFAQPNLRWRILRPDEIVQDGDWMNARVNSQEVGPPDGGWLAAPSFYFGKEASVSFGLYFARPVTEKPRLGSGEAYRLLSKEQLEDFIPFGDFGMGTGLCGTSSIDDPAKEPEHPAGPKPDPGEGYRLLSKDPPEELQEGDEFFHSTLGRWRESIQAGWGYKRQDTDCWYRRKIETAKPAWEPKVGDWVQVKRPQNWKEYADPCWAPQMHHYDGKVGMIESEWKGRFYICGFALPNGLRLIFDRDWLSPAESPASDKPAEPEYREPVLPADSGMACQFSEDGQRWLSGWVYGWVPDRNWVTLNNNSWKYCRIKKDA